MSVHVNRITHALGWVPEPTRTGHTKAVGTGPDAGRVEYGAEAERLLSGGGQAGGQPQPGGAAPDGSPNQQQPSQAPQPTPPAKDAPGVIGKLQQRAPLAPEDVGTFARAAASMPAEALQTAKSHLEDQLGGPGQFALAARSVRAYAADQAGERQAAAPKAKGFLWHGLDKRGNAVRGRVTAASGEEALAHVAAAGHTPHEMYESGVPNPPNLAEKKKPEEAPKPTPAKGSVPMMVTNAMRADLKRLGHSDAQINALRPAEAWDHIQNQTGPAAPAVRVGKTPAKIHGPTGESAGPSETRTNPEQTPNTAGVYVGRTPAKVHAAHPPGTLDHARQQFDDLRGELEASRVAPDAAQRVLDAHLSHYPPAMANAIQRPYQSRTPAAVAKPGTHHRGPITVPAKGDRTPGQGPPGSPNNPVELEPADEPTELEPAEPFQPRSKELHNRIMETFLAAQEGDPAAQHHMTHDIHGELSRMHRHEAELAWWKAFGGRKGAPAFPKLHHDPTPVHPEPEPKPGKRVAHQPGEGTGKITAPKVKSGKELPPKPPEKSVFDYQDGSVAEPDATAGVASEKSGEHQPGADTSADVKRSPALPPEKPTRPLKQAYRAGMNVGSVGFAHEDQADLYELGSKLRDSTGNRNFSSADRAKRQDRANALTERMTKRLGLSVADVHNRARDVYDDVRGQMQGLKDDEHRQVKDNVSAAPRPKTPEEAEADLDRELEMPSGPPATGFQADSSKPQYTFHWKGSKANGEPVEGRVVATDPEHAHLKASALGHKIEAIHKPGQKRNLLPKKKAAGPPTVDSLLSHVLAHGGIDPAALSEHVTDAGEARESGLPLAALRSKGKGGRTLDDLAASMVEAGHLIVPPGRTPDEYLLEQLQAGAKSAHASREDEYNRAAEEYYRELEERRQYESANDIDAAVRAGEAAADRAVAEGAGGEGDSESGGDGGGADEAGDVAAEPGAGGVGDFEFGANAEEPAREEPDATETPAAEGPAAGPDQADETPKEPAAEAGPEAKPTSESMTDAEKAEVMEAEFQKARREDAHRADQNRKPVVPTDDMTPAQKKDYYAAGYQDDPMGRKLALENARPGGPKDQGTGRGVKPPAPEPAAPKEPAPEPQAQPPAEATPAAAEPAEAPKAEGPADAPKPAPEPTPAEQAAVRSNSIATSRADRQKGALAYRGHATDGTRTARAEGRTPEEAERKAREVLAGMLERSGAGAKAAEPEPGGWSPESHLKIAADSPEKLRGVDVFRLLDQAPPERRQSMAKYLNKVRPDLSGDVHDALVDIEDEAKGAATPAQQPVAETPPKVPEAPAAVQPERNTVAPKQPPSPPRTHVPLAGGRTVPAPIDFPPPGQPETTHDLGGGATARAWSGDGGRRYLAVKEGDRPEARHVSHPNVNGGEFQPVSVRTPGSAVPAEHEAEMVPPSERKPAAPDGTQPAGKDAEGRDKMVGKDGATYVRAKAGGEVSPVNGQHYAGGRWMPIHGLSAGKEKPPKGDGVGVSGPPSKSNPDKEEGGAGGQRGHARPMTPEEIEEEKGRREAQKKWDEVNASPLGRMSWLGERPNSKAQATPRLKEWREFAEKAGPAGVKKIIDTLEPEVHAEIDRRARELREEHAQRVASGTFDPTYHKAPDDDLEEWHKNQLKKFGDESVGFMRGGKGHEKVAPGSHYARMLIGEVLGNPDAHGGMVEAFHRVGKLLADAEKERPDPKAIDALLADPNAKRLGLTRKVLEAMNPAALADMARQVAEGPKEPEPTPAPAAPDHPAHAAIRAQGKAFGSMPVLARHGGRLHALPEHQEKLGIPPEGLEPEREKEVLGKAINAGHRFAIVPGESGPEPPPSEGPHVARTETADYADGTQATIHHLSDDRHRVVDHPDGIELQQKLGPGIVSRGTYPSVEAAVQAAGPPPAPAPESPKGGTAPAGGHHPHTFDVVVRDQGGKKEKRLTNPFHVETLRGIREGTLSADELRRRFDAFAADPEAVHAAISAGLKKTGMRSPDKIRQSADAIYGHMLGQFNVGDGFVSFQLPIGQGAAAHRRAQTDAYRKHLSAVTDADLKAHAEKRASEAAERVKTYTNPETYEEFERFVAARGEDKLTPEQRARWDDLQAGRRREREQASREARASVSGFQPGQEATGDVGIVEGHHQKRNAPTFTVTVANRLGDERFREALERAKHLGGSYVNAMIAKRYGATPGFQFFDRDKAEQFAKVLRGESVSTADDLRQRQAEALQGRADSLAERGAGLEQAGHADLSRDRLTNTARRADMAAGAEARAREQIATGRTLARIGEAMGRGELRHLNRVNSAAGVGTLDRVLRMARWDRYHEAAKDAGFRQSWQDFHAAPHDEEDVAKVGYPYPQINSNDLRHAADQLKDEPGLMRVAQKLAKAADTAPKFKTQGGGYKFNGGRLVGPAELTAGGLHGTEAAIPADKRVRVHTSHDWRLSRQGQGPGPFYTADAGKSFGTSPAVAVSAALRKGHELDLVDAPTDKLLTIDDPRDIDAMRSVASKLRRHPHPSLRRIGESFADRLEHYDRLQRADIKSPAELRAALREYLPLRAAADKEDPVKAKERALIGRKIDGFFPTPGAVIDEMIDRAGIEPGHTVLEPSAGKGDILDALRERHPEATAHGIEQNADLAEINRLKGHNVQHRDFLDVPTTHFATGEDRPDRILMNPPFEGGADAAHVRHAYDLLKPGGRMVAIMSAGPFFREDRKAKEFRDWLASVGGEAEEMPEGSFAGADAFRQTGVRTRMVTINKPAG